MPSASFSYQVLGKVTHAVSIRRQNAACLRLKKKLTTYSNYYAKQEEALFKFVNGISGDIFVYRLLVTKKRNT